MKRRIEYFIKCVGKGESLPLPAFMAGDSICRRISRINILNAPVGSAKYIVNKFKKLSKVILYHLTFNMTTSGNKKKFVFKPKTKYEVSCTFIDKHQFINMTQEPLNKNRLDHHPLLRLKSFTTWLQKKYLPLFNNCNYEFYLELSDPQQVCERKYARLHLHGIISFDSEYEVFLFKLNDLYNLHRYGSIQFNEYRANHWIKYITKDYKKVTKLLEHYNKSVSKVEQKIKIHYKSMERLSEHFN